MGKSLRSSRRKANKSQLRSIVFDPAAIARKRRLSAKLIELALQPLQIPMEGLKMRNEEQGRRFFELSSLTMEVSDSADI